MYRSGLLHDVALDRAGAPEIPVATRGRGHGQTTPTMRVVSTAFFIMLALLGANIAFNMVAIQLGYKFPYDSFLAAPGDMFGDYFKAILGYPGGLQVRPSNVFGLHDRIASAAAQHPYPGIAALAAQPLNPLHLMPVTTLINLLNLAAMRIADPAAVFILSNLALLAFYCWTVARFSATRDEAIAWCGMGLLSYPMLTVITCGNLNAGLTATLIIAVMVMSMRRERPILAALLLAVAVNMRPNAILFAVPMLLLFPARDRIKLVLALGVAGLSILGLSLAAAHALFADYRLATLFGGLGNYYKAYVVGKEGLNHGSSLFGGLKMLFGYQASFQLAATGTALAILAAAAALHALHRLTTASLVFLTCAACCLGTSVFADYHLLVFMIVPVAVARETDRSGRWPNWPETLALIATAVTMAPKHYAYAREVSYQTVLNPLVLLAASLAIIVLAVRGHRPLRLPAMSSPRLAL